MAFKKIGGPGKASLYKLLSSHKLSLLLNLIGLGTKSKNSAHFSQIVLKCNDPSRNIDITAAFIKTLIDTLAIIFCRKRLIGRYCGDHFFVNLNADSLKKNIFVN